MGRPSIGIVGATLAVISLPGLAAGQGIPVRTFQSAADFAKTTRLQRLASGDRAFTLPHVPPGIPGFYDPTTKIFTLAAALPSLGPQTSPTRSTMSTSAVEPCVSHEGESPCAGSITVDINITTVSPGIKPGDTVFCTVETTLGRTYDQRAKSIVPDDYEERSKNFGVGQTASVTNQFNDTYKTNLKGGNPVYLEIYTECVIPNASDGHSYGPHALKETQPADLGPQSTYANLTF